MRGNKEKQNTDLIVAIFMLIVVTIFWIQVQHLSSPLDIIYPRFILICMLILSSILLIKSLIKPDRGALFLIKNKTNLFIAVVAGTLWITIFSILGFFISSMIIFIFLTIIIGEKSERNLKKIISTIIVSSIIVIIVYFLFSKILEVPLPKGFWV
jgi:membrane-associated HD superfamily phosphohydrolase